MAEILINEVSKPCCIDGQVCHISCSIGIAIYPKNGTNIDSLLLNADTSMYTAKRKEPGTYHF